MLMLRLARAGSKKRPVYHLVAADKRARRDGRFIENLGYYIPTRDILVLQQDRIDQWVNVGAQMTDTAKALVKKARKQGPRPPANQKQAEVAASEAAPAPVSSSAPASE
jgi:small subunit ribosomal protein S16